MCGGSLSGVIMCFHEACIVVSRGVVSWGSFLSSVDAGIYLSIYISKNNNNNNWLQHPCNMGDHKFLLMRDKGSQVLGDVLRARLWYARCDQPYVGHIHLLVVLLLRFPPPEYGVFSGYECYMLSVYRFRVGLRFCG